MKTPACLLILLFSSLLINAQLGKGQWMVGGVADFSYKNTDINKPSLKEDSKETMYQLLPGAGYFFMNRLCGGVRLHISGADNKENSDAFNFGFFLSSRYDAHTSGIGFSPFIRYYILPAASKINVWERSAMPIVMKGPKQNFSRAAQRRAACLPLHKALPILTRRAIIIL